MKHHVINSTVIGVVFISVLAGGCAVQPKKSTAPEPLVSEIKSIEGPESVTAYQHATSPRKGEQAGVPGGKTTYIVKKGDTLSGISKKYGVSVQTLLKANHISKAKNLKVGQKLVIPTSYGKSSTSHTSHSSYTPPGSVAGDTSSRGFIWPVKGQVVSQFGEIRNGAKNMGIYILPQPNQKIVASKKGAVEAVSDTGGGMHVIVIKHDGGSRTIYECRYNPVVGEGSPIEQGQPIATTNQSSTGKPQEVNFKIYIRDKPVNPMSYLP